MVGGQATDARVKSSEEIHALLEPSPFLKGRSFDPHDRLAANTHFSAAPITSSTHKVEKSAAATSLAAAAAAATTPTAAPPAAAAAGHPSVALVLKERPRGAKGLNAGVLVVPERDAALRVANNTATGRHAFIPSPKISPKTSLPPLATMVTVVASW
jgi:hypothetical protein